MNLTRTDGPPPPPAPPTVWLVGAGPGDADLLTRRAVRAIRQATVLLVDDLVGADVLRFARRTARIVHVGKRGGCASTPQAFIERLMVAEALRGERVVRLKGGDPFLFGRGGEELQALQAHGIPVEVVPGISAGIAASAALQCPLTHRDHAHGVMFLTGHPRPGGAPLDWAALGGAVAQGVTLVVYMGVAQADALQRGLLQTLDAATPVAIVQHASLPQQRCAHGRLGELAAVIARERLGSPAIIVVGDVLRALGALAAPATIAPLPRQAMG